jgi:hypothetical protein
VERRSSYGRRVRQPVDYRTLLTEAEADSSESDSTEEFSVTFSYDGELDLFVLLVYRDTIKDNVEDEGHFLFIYQQEQAFALWLSKA